MDGAATRRDWRMEALVCAALFAAAALVRLPNLESIPRLTDETAEVALARAIAFEGARPLTGDDAYEGPLWMYALAAVLALTGPQPWVPRGFALLLGSLVVPATYLLARSVAGRRAAMAAALLSATAFGPVVLTSHVAWASNSAPLWITLALWALHEAAGRDGDRAARPWLAASGALWGVALNMHPYAVLPLLGAATWWLADAGRRRLARTPAFALGAAALLGVLGPLLVANARSGLGGVSEALDPRNPVVRDFRPAAILANARVQAAQVGRAAGAGALDTDGDGPDDDPAAGALLAATDRARPLATAVYALAVLGSIALAAARGPRFVGVVGLPAAVLLVLVNRGTDNFYDLRYVAFLLPLAYVALGAHAARLAGTGRRGAFAAALVVAALAAYPLVSAAAYYARETNAGRTNAPLVAVADRLGTLARPTGMHVFVDKALRPLKMGGGGDPARAFEQLLALRAVPHTLADEEEIRWSLLHDAKTTFWLLAADATANRLIAEFRPALRDAVTAGGEGWRVLARHGGGSPDGEASADPAP